MVLNLILATLAFLSLALTLWQFIVAMRFPLHRRVTDRSYTPPVTVLKPLKGADAETFPCLESWLEQDYAGPVQILFGVASPDDPVCEVVRQLIGAHPERDAQLVICQECLGANAKVSTLIQLQRLARQDIVVAGDADVRISPDFLVNAVAPFRDAEVGLATCFYRLANPSTLAMQWEAIAVNADFWSQVLQARNLKPMDFALGAVMVATRRHLDAVGGFLALVDFLADDYQLGNRIANGAGRIALSPIVVECWESPKNWSEVWLHQLRWGRTIRVCRPLGYFFSILGNATLWPLLWWLVELQSGLIRFSSTWWNSGGSIGGDISAPVIWNLFPRAWVFVLCLLARVLTAMMQQQRLTQSYAHAPYFWLIPVKDLLNAAVWALAFLASTVQWRGQSYRLLRGGKLVKIP